MQTLRILYGGEIMKGSIEFIKTREVKNKKGDMMRAYDLTINGEKYSSLDRACADLAYGDSVDYEISVNGQYKNISKIKKIGQTKVTDALESDTEKKPDNKYWKDRNLEIRFQGLGKIAVDVVLKAHEKDKEPVDYVKMTQEIALVITELDKALGEYLRQKEPPEAMI
jgi:hypothetical protein